MLFKKTLVALGGCLVAAAMASSLPANAAAPLAASGVRDNASTVEKATYGNGRHYGWRGNRGYRNNSYRWNRRYGHRRYGHRHHGNRGFGIRLGFGDYGRRGY